MLRYRYFATYNDKTGKTEAVHMSPISVSKEVLTGVNHPDEGCIEISQEEYKKIEEKGLEKWKIDLKTKMLIEMDE